MEPQQTQVVSQRDQLKAPWMKWVTDVNRPWIIAVDFDGTIAHHGHPIGPVRDGIRDMLLNLRKDNCKIIIFSGRMSPFWTPPGSPIAEKTYQAIKTYLEENEIPYDTIDRGDQGKLPFDVLYDDKVVQVTNNPIEDEKAIRRLLSSHAAERDSILKRIESEDLGVVKQD